MIEPANDKLDHHVYVFQGRMPAEVYKRLQALEERILEMESSSPEYAQCFLVGPSCKVTNVFTHLLRSFLVCKQANTSSS